MPIVTDYKPLPGFLTSLQTNPMLIRWHESLSQLDINIIHLEGKKNIIADALSRIYNPIKMPAIRDSTSSPDNRHSSTAQLPVTTNYLIFQPPYLTIPLPIITSSITTIPFHTKNRITTGNSTRRYEEDNLQYWELLGIDYQEEYRTRALTSQHQQAARAYRQPLVTISAAAVYRLRQAATEVTVATTTNGSTTRAQAQQARVVIKEPQAKKFLHSIVINKQPSLLNRPPTPMPNHIHLNQLGAGQTSPGMSFPFAEPCQYRHTTWLMQEVSAEDFSTDEQPESGEEDMADDGEDGEEEEIEKWEREGSPPRSIEDMADMAEDISRTPPHKRTEVLSPAALAEQRKKSPSTCKSHIE